MKVKYFILSILLGASFLLMPNLSKASGDITLKEVFLSSVVNTTDKTFTVKASVTDLLVVYNSSTKISGAPKEISLGDWQMTDKLAITGQIIGYEDGKLKIQAQTIKYNFTNRQIKKITGYVNSIDEANHKIWLATKVRNQYTIQELANIGQVNGPRLEGYTGLGQVSVGSIVNVTTLWNKLTNSGIKTLAITKLNKNDSLQVISIKRNGTDFVLETGSPTNPILKRGQKFVIQNTTGVNLYFSTSGDSGKFSPKPSNGSILLKNGAMVQYTINKLALTGPINLPFKTDLLETAPIVITVQLEIVN